MKLNFLKIVLLFCLLKIATNLSAQNLKTCKVAFCDTTSVNKLIQLSSLPNLFTLANGTKVKTMDAWQCKRKQIKTNLEFFEIGTIASKPSLLSASYANGQLKVISTANGKVLEQTATVSIPEGKGPFPIIIGMNAPTGSLKKELFDGCIQINFAHDQVVSYAKGSGSINPTDPYFTLYPSTDIGKYSAWTWGISRLIDGLEIVQPLINANISKIAITGCSYAGKMALFAGAFEDRIALTIVQESGGGGINAWRMSEQYTARTGINVEKIDNTNYSWFKPSLKNYQATTLPYDHHSLIALIAPRALLILGNPGFTWLCDESGYKATMAAKEAWVAMDAEDNIAWDFLSDHNHCVAADLQNNAVDAFVKRFLFNQNIATNFRVAPAKDTKIDTLIDAAVFSWKTPKFSSKKKSTTKK